MGGFLAEGLKIKYKKIYVLTSEGYLNKIYQKLRRTMAERETIFTSKTSYNGIFSFNDFYNFCYQWLTEETGLLVTEKKYSEKLTGDSKDVEVVWEGFKDMTDYFRIEVKIEMRVTKLTSVEITQEGVKVKTNRGRVEMKVKGVLARDYKGKFDMGAYRKFLRGIYEKWVIPARIDQFEGKIMEECGEFLSQAKAYLDLEAKR